MLLPFLQTPTIQSLALNFGVITAACCYYSLQERITANCIYVLTKENPFDTWICAIQQRKFADLRPSLSEKAITTFHALLICLPPLASIALSHSQILLERLQAHPAIHHAVVRRPLSYVLKMLSSLLPFIKECPTLSERVIYIAFSCLVTKEIWDKYAPVGAHINHPRISKHLPVITGGALTAAAGTFSIPSALFTAWCFSILQYTARKERESLKNQLEMQIFDDSRDFLPPLRPLLRITPEIKGYFESRIDKYPERCTRSIERLKKNKGLSTEDLIAIINLRHRGLHNEGDQEEWSIRQDLLFIVSAHLKQEGQQLDELHYSCVDFLDKNGIADLTQVNPEDFLARVKKSLKRKILLSPEDRNAFLLILMVNKVLKTKYCPEEELAAALKARPSDCCKAFQKAYSKSVQKKMEEIISTKESFETNQELSETFNALLNELIDKDVDAFYDQNWEDSLKELLDRAIESLEKGIIPFGEDTYEKSWIYLAFLIWKKFGKEAGGKIKSTLSTVSADDLSQEDGIEKHLTKILHPPTENPQDELDS